MQVSVDGYDAFMLVATASVLMMTVPAQALYVAVGRSMGWKR